MKLGFLPYEAMNYKAAQACLDRKAARGWGLRHIYLGCIARFERAQSPRHFVDLDIRRFMDEEPDEDYIQLCADAGWEHVQTLRGMHFFRAAAGADPAPIQSDAGLEWERYWQRYARRNLLTSTLVLVAAILLTSLFNLSPGPGWSLSDMVLSNSALLYLLALGCGLVSILLSFVIVPLYLFRCRRSGRVENPGPGAWLQDALFRIFTPLYLLAACVSLLELSGTVGTTAELRWSPYQEEYTATVEACREYPVVMAADLGLSDNVHTRYLEGHKSILAESLVYSESVGSSEDDTYHSLSAERYDCISNALARWVMGRRTREVPKGASLREPLLWEPFATPGFEESYVSRKGGSLLLRRGTVVALVSCPGLDLTQPERLAVIRIRLGL